MSYEGGMDFAYNRVIGKMDLDFKQRMVIDR